MSIFILALFSYIFNPSVGEYEKKQIVQKFNIPFALKRIPKVSVNYDKLIKLYNDGKYREYIREFRKEKKKFIYVKGDKTDYSKLYLYYTLSLKILSKNNAYQDSICMISASMNGFENLPPFVLREFKNDCRTLKEISVETDKDLKFYINGLLVENNTVYTDENLYNLTVCFNKECKYFKTKSSVLKADEYKEYFTWNIHKGLYISNTIPEAFFRYYNVNQIHYFYKKGKKLFHKVKLNNGIIILEEELNFENDNKENLNLKVNHKTNNNIPVYKKWYFYAGIFAVVGITAGGVYWFQNSGKTNTTVSWQ